jgi:hypothetical protein
MHMGPRALSTGGRLPKLAGVATVRRVLAAGLALMLIAAWTTFSSAAPASARAGTQCSKTWHTITHGETGLRVRVEHNTNDPHVYVNGVPGVEPWTQLFLFCRDPLWGAGQYAVYSNSRGSYWHGTSDGVFATAPAIENVQQLFYVFTPANAPGWTAMQWMGSRFIPKYAGPDRSAYGYHLRFSGTLSGNNLFRITPADPLG